MALATSTQEALYQVTLIRDFLLPVTPIIYSDSQSALKLAENPVHHDRSKHIDIRFHFIREKLDNGEVSYLYIPTDQNVADLFTKPATKHKLMKFHTRLFGV